MAQLEPTPQADADLMAVAKAADEEGRPWEWQGGYPQRVLRVGDVAIVADVFESPDAPSRFAEFISTFDPPTVISLLALLAEKDAQIERLKNCDCFPDQMSSRACHKCGRRGIQTAESMTSIIAERDALAAQVQPPAMPGNGMFSFDYDVPSEVVPSFPVVRGGETWTRTLKVTEHADGSRTHDTGEWQRVEPPASESYCPGCGCPDGHQGGCAQEPPAEGGAHA